VSIPNRSEVALARGGGGLQNLGHKERFQTKGVVAKKYHYSSYDERRTHFSDVLGADNFARSV